MCLWGALTVYEEELAGRRFVSSIGIRMGRLVGARGGGWEAGRSRWGSGTGSGLY